jgi:hypothetical protein
MSKLQDKPGRQMSLVAMVDRGRDRVQIIRNLKATRGCMCDSGNMGWMPLAEWRAFLERETVMAAATPPSLMERYRMGNL